MIDEIYLLIVSNHWLNYYSLKSPKPNLECFSVRHSFRYLKAAVCLCLLFCWLASPICTYSLYNISAFLITILSFLQCDHLPPNKCSWSRSDSPGEKWHSMVEGDWGSCHPKWRCCVSVNKSFLGQRTMFSLTLSVWPASVLQSATFLTAKHRLPHCALMQLGSFHPQPLLH